MVYLVQTFAVPLIATLVLGLVFGWVAAVKEDRGRSGWAALAITLFAAMVVASALKWLPGRPGLWLDTFVLFSGAYLIGCVVGGLAHGLGGRPSDLAVAGAGAGPAAAMAEPLPPVQLSGAAAAAEAMAQGDKPQGIDAPRESRPDDLKLVRGIGPQNEARLNALGIWHFDQIAAWTAKETMWVGGYLAFPGRIEREDWVGQAATLAAGGTTAFSERAGRGEVATSRTGVGDLGHADDRARPQGLVGPRGGVADDLELIRGVGKEIEGKLYGLGLWHFDQIAALSEAELGYISAYVGAPGRAVRDNWSGEARILAGGGETEHSRRIKAARRQDG
ncbi:hypothetical protein [Phreatobacter sp.]|uniref:hypothetical protein n=1 Tax=Phreatobacter sp. TaxID=1966341 RepID=UPI003F6F7FF1